LLIRLLAHFLSTVEKPESYISSTINVGVYCFDRSVFDEIRQAMEEKARVAA
jgi:mannose-1-phosphate guanylyltransferase